MHISSFPLALILSAGAVLAQPYLPLEAGKRWTFRQTEVVETAGAQSSQRGTAVLEVLEATEVDGQPAFVLAWRGEAGRVVVSATEDEVIVHRHTDERILLPANFKDPEAGAKRVAAGEVRIEAYTVGEAERVETPAGAYDAVPVSATVKAPATSVGITVFYARGVGPVKVVEEVKAPGATITRTLLLDAPARERGSTLGPAPDAEDPDLEEVELEEVELEEVELEEVELEEVEARPALDLASLVQRGAQADLGPLLARLDALRAAAKAATGEHVNGTVPDTPLVAKGGQRLIVADRLDHQRVTAAGLTVSGSMNHCFVVCAGDVVISGDVRHSVIVTSGNVTVAGELRHSLLVCQGRVTASGELRHSTVVAQGKLSVLGELKHTTVEAGSLNVLGSAQHSVVLNGDALPGSHNERATASPSLRSILPLK